MLRLFAHAHAVFVSILVLAGLGLALAAPQSASADEPPVEINTLVPDREVVAGQTFLMYANLNRPLLGNEIVTMKQNGSVIGVCGANGPGGVRGLGWG